MSNDSDTKNKSDKGRRTEETYYELLRIPENATVPEILSAYHRCKAAFAEDSLATYSLFSPDEMNSVRQRLDEAYLTLTNPRRRAAYDHSLSDDNKVFTPPQETIISDAEIRRRAEERLTDHNTENKNAPEPTLQVLQEVTGPALKDVRNALGLNLEEVAQVTRIAARYIEAIEEENFDLLPTNVYLSGFLRNLSQLYRLDPRHTAEAYLKRVKDASKVRIAKA